MVKRWKCVGYCVHCSADQDDSTFSKEWGHFEKSSDGAWVRADSALALERDALAADEARDAAVTLSLKLGTAEARIAALESALIEYGQHSRSCRKMSFSWSSPCDCGFQETKELLKNIELPSNAIRTTAETSAEPPYRQLWKAVAAHKADTFQCPQCGYAEDWWTDSNADYATRELLKASEPKTSAETSGKQFAPIGAEGTICSNCTKTIGYHYQTAEGHLFCEVPKS